MISYSFHSPFSFPDIEDRVRILAPGILAELISEMPGLLLPADFNIGNQVVIDRKGVVTLSLPDDFLRLVSVKMSDWNHPVVEITTDPALLALQNSEWEGVRGNPQRPVVTFGLDGYGERSLKMYGSDNDSTLEHAHYVQGVGHPQLIVHCLLVKLLPRGGILQRTLRGQHLLPVVFLIHIA